MPTQYQKLIHMIVNLTKNILNTIKTHLYFLNKQQSITRLHSLNTYGFAQWNRQTFAQYLKKQLQEQKPPSKNIYQNIQYFKDQGWTLQYHPQSQMIKYTKTLKDYQACVFTQITANPPNDPSNNQRELLDIMQPKDQQKIKFAYVVIWIRKKDSDRWMVGEMSVMQGSVFLTTLCFRRGQPRANWITGQYAGPTVNSLPMEVMNIVNHVLEQVGLKPKMIQNMVIEASSKADEIDYEWLVSLKQTLE